MQIKLEKALFWEHFLFGIWNSFSIFYFSDHFYFRTLVKSPKIKSPKNGIVRKYRCPKISAFTVHLMELVVTTTKDMKLMVISTCIHLMELLMTPGAAAEDQELDEIKIKTAFKNKMMVNLIKYSQHRISSGCWRRYGRLWQHIHHNRCRCRWKK